MRFQWCSGNMHADQSSIPSSYTFSFLGGGVQCKTFFVFGGGGGGGIFYRATPRHIFLAVDTIFELGMHKRLKIWTCLPCDPTDSLTLFLLIFILFCNRIAMSLIRILKFQSNVYNIR